MNISAGVRSNDACLCCNHLMVDMHLIALDYTREKKENN